MAQPQDPTFERLVTQRKKDLQCIARHIQGEGTQEPSKTKLST